MIRTFAGEVATGCHIPIWLTLTIFFISLFMASVKSSLIKGENVYLRGFGSFIIKKRAQKTGRNISKNTTIIIPAHNIPAFKPAKEFVTEVKKNKK